jgi:3-oxoacyl-[acyl-carrier protein] reductase
MTSTEHDLSGRRVLVPGGTGTVGTGVVRRYLAAGADVVVPTRTQSRADDFRRALGEVATDRLHLVVHDYTTFTGAEDLAAQMELNLGGIDDVVAPIGGWWAGKRLWEIDEADWQNAFVGLATTHMAVVRATLPRMKSGGAYTLIVGDSATWPVPGSGLVSMEQSAVLMMQRVLEAELQGEQRVFVLVLGPVSASTDSTGSDQAVGSLTAEHIGAVAVAASHSSAAGRTIPVHDQAEVDQALALLRVVAVE